MSEQIPQCEQCQQRYTLFRRKKQCDLCGQIFCSKCVPKSSPLIPLNSPRKCTTCLLIINERTTPDQLTTIRAKHLRAYLIHSKITSTNRLQTCLEKQDLINLIEAKKRQIPDDSYVFVERREIRSNQTTTTIDNSNQQEVQQSVQQPTPPVSNPTPVQSNERIPERVVHPPETIPEPVVHPPEKIHSDRLTLADVSSVESIHDLTIRQLKEILIHNFVSTKGCVEKIDLISKVELLYRDQQQQKLLNTTMSTTQLDENLCKVCMDATIDCVFLDCGHLCTCVDCGKQLSECPICRSYIIRVVRVFKT